ncbi:hypothetical protein F0562_022917 [Nyssa sinensis]|uniref:Uncharacterized protein n=1 Tax=Nyssa sinensis TaxID=561372 RepID=A0A5J5BF12_9ASTE|nr:hypothetical protein F0562_022917 [Nyssa sinensis]
MASYMSVRFPQFFYYNARSFESEDRDKFRANAPYTSKFNVKEHQNYGLPKNNLSLGFSFMHFTASRITSPRWFPSGALSSVASSADSDQTNSEEKPSGATADSCEVEFNRVNCLVWVLHESARSFSVAIQTLELARSSPELSMAWVGVDVHAWHKHIAYKVAVYALLKAAIEVESFLSHKRSNNPSPVREMLSSKINYLEESIESELNVRHPKLVQWFRTVELPRIAGLFIPLFKKWSMEYAGSGVAGIILAMSCCAAVGKLGSGRISCPLFSISIEDVFIELMNLSYSLVSVDKLHHLATEAGFEEDFLSHFGTKVLPCKNSEEIEFWIGLVQKKLSVALHRESVISGKHTFCDKDQENSLAILGLFAFLGRETRLFLSEMGIKDLDEQVKDFLSYLECGSLFIYPEFSSLAEYQLFMEVVTDEIGWLDFYAAFHSKINQERRRSKQFAIQAEKEIVIYTVFTVCYDVFSGFAHYSNSIQQPLDANLLAFLLRRLSPLEQLFSFEYATVVISNFGIKFCSQSLLSICLEDYWAAYDKSGELLKFGERDASDPTPSLRSKGTTNSSLTLEAQKNPIGLFNRGSLQVGSKLSKATGPIMLAETSYKPESKVLHESLLRKSTIMLVSAGTDIWMGTQLLFIDILDALGLLMKQLRGRKVTKRERKKIERTVADIATLIPVTILMLLPVSAVGHAAMFAAIKKYMPSLIPSPYSRERLDIVKQLKRTKKMEVQSWSTTEDASSAV